MVQDVVGDVDCLYMNIYVPVDHGDQPLTTMLFIHGGAFLFGSGDDMFYGPEYFLKENVILVTINYRLTIFGFLNTGTIDAPGNQGLKDQGRAIRFYKDVMAEAVHGDPDKITVFGESAGAASVSFQLASPLNEGYISRAILQSGSATDIWAYNSHPDAVTEKTIEIFSLTATEPAEIAKELTAMPASDIINKFAAVFDGDKQLDGLIYIPTLEADIEGVQKFLPKHMHQILVDGTFNRVPVLMGVNSDEGALFVNEVRKFFDGMTDKNPLVFVENMPPDAKTNCKDPGEFITSTFEYYTGAPEAGGNEVQLTKMLSDLLFFFNYWIWINTYRLHNNDVYAYYFQYRTTGGMIKDFMNVQESTCMHADELVYMFYMNILENVYEPGSDESTIANHFTKMWTNWAKYGDPTPDGSGFTKWEKYNDNRNVMTISKELKMVNAKDLENNFSGRMCRMLPLVTDRLEEYLKKFEYC